MEKAEELVRTAYPSAEATFQKAVYETGRGEPKEPAKWVIYSAGELGAAAIGEGNDKKAAWENAAKRIQKGKEMEQG